MTYLCLFKVRLLQKERVRIEYWEGCHYFGVLFVSGCLHVFKKCSVCVFDGGGAIFQCFEEEGSEDGSSFAFTAEVIADP